MEVRVIVFGTAVMLLLVGGIISFVFLYMRRQQEQRNELQKVKEENQRELLLASVNAQENVRRQIGGDLHDDIGTLLSATRLALAQLGRQLKTIPDTNQNFSQTNDLLNEAIGNVRRISKDLMPSTLDEFGLIIALSEFTEKLTTSTGIKVEFNSNDIEQKRFPRHVELIFFRIAQELTNNSLKHAQAQHIVIDLEHKKNILLMTVTDDGVGFDLEKIKADPTKGIGLKNIESRLATINGRIIYDVSKGKGSTFLIETNLENA